MKSPGKSDLQTALLSAVSSPESPAVPWMNCGVARTANLRKLPTKKAVLTPPRLHPLQRQVTRRSGGIPHTGWGTVPDPPCVPSPLRQPRTGSIPIELPPNPHIFLFQRRGMPVPPTRRKLKTIDSRKSQWQQSRAAEKQIETKSHLRQRADHILREMVTRKSYAKH